MVDDLPGIEAAGVPLPLADLPLARTERADAALNRRRILEAAESLFADRGVEHVTMHDVAREACVGVGTLYRRFGDRAGLALALLEERERRLQEDLIRGAAPLGPGAPAADRIRAFGRAYLAFQEEHGEILAMAQGGRPPVGGPWQLYRTHLTLLLREAAPGIDAEYATETLINALGAGLHAHLRHRRGWRVERVEAGWLALANAWIALGAP
jgi:AcrR family transcriptional regulator